MSNPIMSYLYGLLMSYSSISPMISQDIPIVATKNHIISRDFRLSPAPASPSPPSASRLPAAAAAAAVEPWWNLGARAVEPGNAGNQLGW